MDYTWLSFAATEEWGIFESLFSEEDINMIIGIKPMPFNDFLRILYILQTINLRNLELDVLRKYYKYFMDVWDDHFGSAFDSDSELHTYAGWLADFWVQIADKSIQEDYQKKLELNVLFQK